MPKRKNCLKLIPKIYQQNAENIMLFAWVNAQKKIVPAITVEQAIWSYFKFVEIDDWDMDCAITTYHNMQKVFLEDCQS
jgi:hypothetical protein